MTGKEGASHRVRSHLHLEAAEYDRAIRTFIPGYEAMLALAAETALAGAPATVVDLGAGTGALSAVLLERSPAVRVELLDVDPEMLEVARTRPALQGGRASFREGSFTGPLPAADAFVASLSLHHLPTREERTAVFRGVFQALPPEGILVDADVTMPRDPGERAAAYLAWAEHLVASGIPEPQAWRHFLEWSGEDTYLSPEEELGMLEAAGFQAELLWQDRVSTLLVGRKGVSPGG